MSNKYNDNENHPNYEEDGDRNQEDFNDFDDDEFVQLPGVDDLPLFSNPIAQKLDSDVKEKGKSIEDVSDKIADMKERVKVMKEHFRNVQQELDHTNALNGAKQAEINTESHLRQLSLRSLGKAKGDSKTFQSDIESIQEQLQGLQNVIYKSNETLDEFKMQMNWNQEELEQWAVASRQKEDDNIALQKYTRSDEAKIKELTFELELLTKDLLKRKERLDNEITDTQAKQMELDRIASDFKASHTERQTLVDRWQDIITEMKARDVEINRIGEAFAMAKSERVVREALLNKQTVRLTSQQGENKDIEIKSESIARIVSRKREELLTGIKKQQELKDELESLKNELTTAAETLVAKRNANSNKTHSIDERRVALERERQKYQTAKDKLDLAKDGTVQAEGTAREAEEALSQKEKELTVQQSKMKTLKEKLLKESQSVHELKREEVRTRGDVSGARSTCKNMDTQLHVLDKEASRQQELLYNAEFQIQQIERKVARGSGERSDEEKKALKLNIEAAELEVREVKEKKKLLQGQARKIANELANAKLSKEKTIEKKIVLTEKLSEKDIGNRMMEEEMKRDVKDKEEITVLNDLLRLDVKRLRDLLSSKADAVFSLENRKQQLTLSMEERKSEVQVHREVLKAEMKGLLEERHTVIIDLNARLQQVEKLKARFEAIANRADDEEGHSQSYFIIQAAQKREELQRRGDELDHLTRVAERELRAQQLTLDHLTARNTAFKDSFRKVEVDGDDAEVLKQLEERAKLAKDSLFRKKKELQRLNTDIEEDARRLESITNQHIRVLKQREHLDSAKQQVEEELLSQQTQLNELAERVHKITSKHRVKTSAAKGIDMAVFEHGSLEEKSAKAEVVKDCIQNVLYTLGQLSSEFPEVNDFLHSKLKEADLRVPSKPPARGPSMLTGGGASTGTGAGAGTGAPSSRGRPNNNNINNNLNSGSVVTLGSAGSSRSGGHNHNNNNSSSSIVVQPRSFNIDF